MISGTALHERGLLVYQQYMDHLYRTQEPQDSVTVFAKGYEDFLQCPLQVKILGLTSNEISHVPTYFMLSKSLGVDLT